MSFTNLIVGLSKFGERHPARKGGCNNLICSVTLCWMYSWLVSQLLSPPEIMYIRVTRLQDGWTNCTRKWSQAFSGPNTVDSLEEAAKISRGIRNVGHSRVSSSLADACKFLWDRKNSGCDVYLKTAIYWRCFYIAWSSYVRWQKSEIALIHS